MDNKLIVPPNYLEITGPLIFLAGPILGARDWQKEAIRHIRKKNQEIYIASPRGHNFSEASYYDQIDWEHFYLQRASENGVILFWLAREEKHMPGRAFAQTTRFELGEASAIHRVLGAKITVGIEKGFSGARYVIYTLSKKCPEVQIHDNLQRTCETAIRLVRG